jgi:hypothetical protein
VRGVLMVTRVYAAEAVVFQVQVLAGMVLKK